MFKPNQIIPRSTNIQIFIILVREYIFGECALRYARLSRHAINHAGNCLNSAAFDIRRSLWDVDKNVKNSGMINLPK